MTPRTPKELRLAAGLSIERAAVAAGVTSPTIRLFEADPSAAPRARAKLETFYANLQVRLASGANTSPPAAA
jgi:transcriptional regulator with XRE-family HTH domain